MKYILTIIFLSSALFLTLLTTSSSLLKPKEKILNKAETTIDQIETLKETIAPKPTIIQDNGLPNRHQINTTFVPQAPEKNWDQPWQDACEEAAILTVKYYYEKQTPTIETIKADILDLVEYQHQKSWSKDVNLSQMSQIVEEKYGYKTKVLTNPSLEELKSYISQDIPIVVPANGKILFQENKRFKDGGPYYHNLVILGYNDDKNQFITHDVGTQFGAYFKYSYNLLLESIHDLPPSGDKTEINKGDKSVLILLK